MNGVNQVSRSQSRANHTSSVDHQRLQKSTTLNRRFVRRPNAAKVQAQKKNVVAAQAKQADAQKVASAKQQRATGAGQKASVRAVSVATRRTEQGLIQRKMRKIQPSAAFMQQQKRLEQQGAQQAGRRVDAKQLAKIRQQAVADLKKVQKSPTVRETPDVGPQSHKILTATKAKMAARQNPVPVTTLTPQERKDQAIQQALRRMQSAENTRQDFGEAKAKKQYFWQKKRFAVAAVMAVMSIAVLGYLVSLNLPDLSVRVAAMQAGISNAYPSYVPSNYRLDGLVGEDNGKITMNFKNDLGKTFTLMEEKSSWDSSAVLANYVKKNWGEDYSVAKGQGLTIYISGSKAAWVNGGVFYIVDGEAAELNSSDLHDIAVSL